jgi:hypothetical protein
LAHLLAIVAGWALFFWGWQRVLARGTDFSELRLLMLGAAIVVPVVTVSWILHNRGIHRRKGPRRSVPEAVLDYQTDFNGRTVIADFSGLAWARRVDIVIEGASKRYRERTENEAAPERTTANLATQAHATAEMASSGSGGARPPGSAATPQTEAVGDDGSKPATS